MNTQKRIPELDGVRGLAILAVLSFHLGLIPAGYFGVDIFLVLSGFLFTQSFARDNRGLAGPFDACALCASDDALPIWRKLVANLFRDGHACGRAADWLYCGALQGRICCNQ